MALKHGIYPKTLIDAIAKALYFDDPDDESAMKLKELRRTKGIDYILQTICELKEDEPLYSAVLNSVTELKEQGMVKGHE